LDLKYISRGVLLLLVLLLPAPAAFAQLGQGASDNIFLGGFVSQGYLNTSRNNYLVPKSVKGTAAFTEAAVILSAQPTDRLRVGIQLLGRTFGVSGRDQVVVDWAYGDYRWKDQLGVRAGKVKLPYGLYNEGRDADMLRTSIFLPQSIYNEKQRDFILAYEGLGFYGNLELGGVGDLDYHVYGGTLTVPDATTGFWNDIYTQAAQEITGEVGEIVDAEMENPTGTAEAQFSSLTDLQVAFPWIFGGAVIWSPPVEGLRLGTTAMQGRFNVQTVVNYDVVVPEGPDINNPGYRPFTINVDVTEKLHYITALSAEYLRGDWTLAAEWEQSKIETSKDKGWYVLAGRRFSDLFSLGAYYSRLDTGYGDEVSPGLPAAALPDYYRWQKDLTVSARFDLNDFWLFKLEYHFIDGVALAEPISLEEHLADPLDRRWGMFAARTTFYF